MAEFKLGYKHYPKDLQMDLYSSQRYSKQSLSTILIQ